MSARFGIPRRAVVGGLLGIAGAVLLAPPARAAMPLEETVDAADQRLLNSSESFRTRQGRAWGYLTRRRGAGPPLPAILLIHGYDGLTPYVRGLARRIAVEGFVVLAPDFLSLGAESLVERTGTRPLIEGLDRRTALILAVGAVDFLVARRDTMRRVGAVGFSWGGGLAQELPLESRDVLASVSFGGEPLSPRLAARLRTRLMAHYGSPDEQTAAALDELADTLEARSVDHRIHVHETAEPTFYDETGEGFDPEAAGEAWERTLIFLNEALR